MRQISFEDVGVIPLSADIGVVVGGDTTLLERPSGASLVFIKVLVGAFYIRAGDFEGTDEFAAADPSATAAPGATPYRIDDEDRVVAFSAHPRMTVRGVDGSAKMLYWFHEG